MTAYEIKNFAFNAVQRPLMNPYPNQSFAPLRGNSQRPPARGETPRAGL